MSPATLYAIKHVPTGKLMPARVFRTSSGGYTHWEPPDTKPGGYGGYNPPLPRFFLDKHAASCRPGTPEGDALSHDWAIYYADLGKHHLRANTPTAARQAFQSALRHDPYNVKTWSRLVRSYFV